MIVDNKFIKKFMSNGDHATMGQICLSFGRAKAISSQLRHVLTPPPPYHNRFTVLFPGPTGYEPVPEENFWTYVARGD